MDDGYYFVALASTPETFQLAKRVSGQWLLVEGGWCESLPTNERVVVYVRAVRQGEEWTRA